MSYTSFAFISYCAESIFGLVKLSSFLLRKKKKIDNVFLSEHRPPHFSNMFISMTHLFRFSGKKRIHPLQIALLMSLTRNWFMGTKPFVGVWDWCSTVGRGNRLICHRPGSPAFRLPSKVGYGFLELLMSSASACMEPWGKRNKYCLSIWHKDQRHCHEIHHETALKMCRVEEAGGTQVGMWNFPWTRSQKIWVLALARPLSVK